MELFKTTETKTTNDYPYGRLRTTAHFSLEFKDGKGFRSVFQTVNPKTGRLNNPKKSTYCPIMLLGQNGEGHYKTIGHEFYSGEKVNDLCQFLQKNYDLFTPEQQENIAMYFLVYLKSTAKAKVIYCGSKAEDVLKIIDETVQTVVRGIKSKSNFWGEIDYPNEELKKAEVPNYSPFKTTPPVKIV